MKALKRLIILALMTLVIVLSTCVVLGNEIPYGEDFYTGKINSDEILADGLEPDKDVTVSAMPESRADRAKFLKGYPLEPPEEQNPNLRGFGSGSAKLVEYDYAGKGFSFPSNFPVPKYAGKYQSKWVSLALYRSDTNMQRTYCIEFGKNADYGQTYTSQDTWDSLSSEKRDLINMILCIGEKSNPTLEEYWNGYVESHLFTEVATQVAIWNIIYDVWGGPHEAASCNVFFANNPKAHTQYSTFHTEVELYTAIPSYATGRSSTAPTYEMQYNSATNMSELALPDSREITHMFIFPTDMGITFGGNWAALQISTSRSDLDNTLVKCTGTAKPYTPCLTTFWNGGNSQAMCSARDGLPDPATGYFRLKVIPKGKLIINKTSEDGRKEGFDFHVTGNGVDTVVTTNANGTASLDGLLAGNYTVDEVNLDDKYVKPDARNVTIEPGQTTTIRFTNTIKKGDVKFAKKCNYSNSFLSGAKYKIYSADGSFTGRELTTKANEWVYSNDILYGDYYLQETTPPTNYALDDKKYPFSITQDKQTIEITADNTPLADVYPEFIAPNSNYRADTEVVASYYIYNDSIAEHAPDRPLTVNFEAYYVDGAGTKQAITAIEKQVICPRFEKNLEYFNVPIQAGIDNIHFTCTVQTPNGVIEPNTANNTQTSDFSVSNVVMSQTPDTAFENKPAGFRVPSESVEVPTGNLATSIVSEAVWQQWTFDTSWTKKNYGVKLSAAQEITPDGNSPSYHKDGDKWVMKSGYGFNLLSKSAITTKSATELPTDEAYTLPQNGNAFFPEFQYSDSVGKYRTLELTAQDSLELEKNQYSITESGTLDYRRIHFSPLYFPDKNYTVKTYIYDCWTPAGMLSVKDTLKPIKIDGDMYEDWIVNHIDKK